eukprot:TRINITY_DN5175_c0_g2_i1.p1 TRINITY_DN5175_c0_g2~~TRINITY_DN5175_c0_g2_i1.p1  ORF type:complete len:294 (-),score=67.50 TRINITY_DN5175_c0_g2_i1:35-916(-)
MQQRKQEEALHLEHQGDSAFNKKFLFFASPDYHKAASHYEKSGTAFQVAKLYEDAARVFVKAAEAFKLIPIFFSAAKCYENAAKNCVKCEDVEQAVEYLVMAADIYAAEEGPAKASAALVEAAGLVGESDPDRALALYLEAVDVNQIEDRESWAAEIYRTVFNFLLSSEKYTELVDITGDIIEAHKVISRTVDLPNFRIANIVIQLMANDIIGARRAFDTFNEDPEFIKSDDYLLCQMFITAYENADLKLLKECQESRQIIHLNNTLGKLILSLSLPEPNSEDTSTDEEDLLI